MIDVNLTPLHNGDSAIIEGIEAERGLRSRLIALGLLPGTPIEVINVDGSGPVVLELRDSRVVIGRRIAQKIEVQSRSDTVKPKHGKRRRRTGKK
jgi:ferrous iron transport protein A